MGDTKIEWTDFTWNPVSGCTKVSQGCKNCYAERLWPKVSAAEAKREGLETRRPFTEVRCHPERLDGIITMRKPRLIFVNSMSDLFHEDVPDAFIDKVFAVMARARQHTFQALTKRAERMLAYMTHPERKARILAASHDVPLAGMMDMPWPLPNVWLGVSVEDQATADERIPLLLQTPAAVRFLSCEPLLGPVDVRWYLWKCCGHPVGGHPGDGWMTPPEPPECCGAPDPVDALHWIIAGSESGQRARRDPAMLDWVRSLRDQCTAAGVAFFWKQDADRGRKIPTPQLDGRTWVEYPT